MEKMTRERIRKMSAAEILKTFADRGQQTFHNVTVEQDFENETTVIHFSDFIVFVNNNDVYIKG